MLIPGETYTFQALEAEMLNNEIVAILVENAEYNCRAIMHVFRENFSSNYLSGDGVLFYKDNDVTAANPNDEFKYIMDINF